MRVIRLSNSSSVALIDEEQFFADGMGSILAYEWILDTHTGYATTYGIGKNYAMRLQDFLFGSAGEGLEWDHENRNKLDCREENLRKVTHEQNGWNRGKNSNNTTGFKGVFCSKYGWWVKIMASGVLHDLGCYPTAIKAAMIYDSAARKYHGRFAFQNIKRFPRLRP